MFLNSQIVLLSLLCKSIANNISLGIAGCYNNIPGSIFRYIHYRENSMLFDIGFRALCLCFDNFVLSMFGSAARIDRFDDNFIFFHVKFPISVF